MIVNPDKFQAIILNRFGRENKEQILHFNGVEVKAHNSVKLLGIEIDSNLNFNSHIHTLTKRAAGQLNYLCRNKNYLNEEAKKILIESFIMSNFNYCPLVWLFCSAESVRKQEKVQERALRFLFDNYEYDYEHLLVLANKPSIEVRKLRLLSIEIFKTIHDLNPSFMKEIFTLNTREGASRNRLVVKTQTSKRYGTETLRSLGPKIWNSLPSEIKNCESLPSFKILIKTWSGAACKCNNCQSYSN